MSPQMREGQFGMLSGTVYALGAGFTYRFKKFISRECVIIDVAEWVGTCKLRSWVCGDALRGKLCKVTHLNFIESIVESAVVN